MRLIDADALVEDIDKKIDEEIRAPQQNVEGVLL